LGRSKRDQKVRRGIKPDFANKFFGIVKWNDYKLMKNFSNAVLYLFPVLAAALFLLLFSLICSGCLLHAEAGREYVRIPWPGGTV
jgi:hypothetical protein